MSVFVPQVNETLSVSSTACDGSCSVVANSFDVDPGGYTYLYALWDLNAGGTDLQLSITPTGDAAIEDCEPPLYQGASDAPGVWTPVAFPEPDSLLLLGIALVGLAIAPTHISAYRQR